MPRTLAEKVLAATERRCMPRSRDSAVGREPGDVETVGCVWRMAEVEREVDRLVRLVSSGFYREFHDIKYHQFY